MVGDRNGCYLLRVRSISILHPPTTPRAVSLAWISVFAPSPSPSRSLHTVFSMSPASWKSFSSAVTVASFLLASRERQTAIPCPVKSSSNPDAWLTRARLLSNSFSRPKGVGEFVWKVFEPRNLRDYQIFSKLMIFFVRVATRVQKGPITAPKENYEITRPPFDAPGHTEFRSSPLRAATPRELDIVSEDRDAESSRTSPSTTRPIAPRPMGETIQLSFRHTLANRAFWLSPTAETFILPPRL